MKKITDYIESNSKPLSLDKYINEDRINGQTLWPGDIIVCKSPIDPKYTWEVTYVDKDKNDFRGINSYGCTVTVPLENIIEIKRITKAPKRKVSPEQARKIKYQIADLEYQLHELQRDMENDPDVLDEVGAGGKATDRYGKEMNKLYDQIAKLKEKLDNQQ